MLNIGTGELILIGVVALLVLGPQRLPELARGLGKFLREFRSRTDEVRGMVEREFYKMDHDEPAPLIKPAEGAVSQLGGSAPALAPGQPGDVSPSPHGPHDGLPAPHDDHASQLTAPMDESDPGHPDYHRADPLPAPEPAASAAEAPAPAEPAVPPAAEPEKKVHG